MLFPTTATAVTTTAATAPSATAVATIAATVTDAATAIATTATTIKLYGHIIKPIRRSDNDRFGNKITDELTADHDSRCDCSGAAERRWPDLQATVTLALPRHHSCFGLNFMAFVIQFSNYIHQIQCAQNSSILPSRAYSADPVIKHITNDVAAEQEKMITFCLATLCVFFAFDALHLPIASFRIKTVYTFSTFLPRRRSTPSFYTLFVRMKLPIIPDMSEKVFSLNVHTITTYVK